MRSQLEANGVKQVISNIGESRNPGGNADSGQARAILGITHSTLMLHRLSGITIEPMPPIVREPDDLEDFIFDLQGRFRLILPRGLPSLIPKEIR